MSMEKLFRCHLQFPSHNFCVDNEREMPVGLFLMEKLGVWCKKGKNYKTWRKTFKTF